tara:strand:+ start:232 stop:594 length:363 start_codon:yes stop_codon:yes gene_type:complete
MQVRGADFVVYLVKDMDRSIEFYRDTLGLKLEMNMGSWVEFDVPPTTLALYREDGDEPESYGGLLALAVENVEESLNELKEKGVKTIMEPLDTPVCHFAIILDPDGNRIGLHWRKDGTFG